MSRTTRTRRDPEMVACAKRVVDAAPPMDAATRDRIALILRRRPADHRPAS